VPLAPAATQPHASRVLPLSTSRPPSASATLLFRSSSTVHPTLASPAAAQLPTVKRAQALQPHL
jgi:hypothetical protein